MPCSKLRAQLGLRPLDLGPSKQQEEAERWRIEKEQAEKDKEAKALMDKIFEYVVQEPCALPPPALRLLVYAFEARTFGLLK